MFSRRITAAPASGSLLCNTWGEDIVPGEPCSVGGSLLHLQVGHYFVILEVRI